jgi:hypothetical protein
MIPRSVKRSVDQRFEERLPAASMTAVLTLRGRRHVVRLVDMSASGARVVFPLVPHIGEPVALQMLDQGQVPAQVRWVRDGQVGLSFDAPIG